MELSPLRPKSISGALAAVADEPLANLGQSERVAAPSARAGPSAHLAEPRNVQAYADAAPGQAMQFQRVHATPVRRMPSFELPENVSRRPLSRGDGGLTGAQLPGRRAAVASWEDGLERRGDTSTGATKRKFEPFTPSSAARNKWRAEAKTKSRRRPITGPERAAARKMRQRLAKRAVSRRIALWRSRVVDGERQTIYVSLAGAVVPKGGRAFKTSTSDQRYLKSRGIASNRPTGSSVERPETLEPYASRRGSNPKRLAYWCVPESVEVAYRDAGVRELYDWQAACLGGPGVLDGRSLVYVAPTSAGKSLVSEVLMLRQLLFRGRRAILVLPFVSLCTERVEQLRRLWGGCGVRIEALFAASEGMWHAGADVAVCTIEKASALLNRLLDEDALMQDIGVIVVDELHLLGDENRGYLLELILIKARLSAAKTSLGDHGGAFQIIGMSATLPNVRTLADWLDAHLHISDNRPVPLSLSIASNGKVLDTLGAEPASTQLTSAAAVAQQPFGRSRSRDAEGLVPLVWECMSVGQGVLVFCATKDWCEKAVTMLTDELSSAGDGCSQDVGANATDSVGSHLGQSHRLQEERLKLLEELRQLPSGVCPVLERALPRGLAYHHAGLTVEERSLLESGFRNGILGCLCATSTLAAGVNLPCRRVIIRSLKIGVDAMDPTRFKQMAGRAGRAGLDTVGECIVMAKAKNEVQTSRGLFSSELEPLKSSLHGQRLARAVLEAVSLGLVKSVPELEGNFARRLLRFHEQSDAQSSDQVPPELLEDLRTALGYLEKCELVKASAPSPAAPHADSSGAPDSVGSASLSQAEDSAEAAEAAAAARATACLYATPLGDGVVHSALKPKEALDVFQDLRKARTGVCLDTDLHLVFLATPIPSERDPDWQRYLAVHERLPPRERAVADAVGVSHSFLMKQAMGHRGPLGAQTDGPTGNWRLERERVAALHRRFWAALALHELLRERPLARVATMFGMARGALQSLQMIAVNYCGMVRQLCERLRWHEMVALFDSLMPRLSFGVSAEILPLCRIPGMYPNRARALVEAGLKTPEEVAKAPLATIELVLGKLYQFESRNTNDSAARRQEAVLRDAAKRILRGAQDSVAAGLQQIEDEADDEHRRVRRTTDSASSAQAIGAPALFAARAGPGV